MFSKGVFCTVRSQAVHWPEGALLLPLHQSVLLQEDDKIASLVGKLGAKRWSLIAQELPGRIGKQCRERYAQSHICNTVSAARVMLNQPKIKPVECSTDGCALGHASLVCPANCALHFHIC